MYVCMYVCVCVYVCMYVCMYEPPRHVNCETIFVFNTHVINGTLRLCMAVQSFGCRVYRWRRAGSSRFVVTRCLSIIHYSMFGV